MSAIATAAGDRAPDVRSMDVLDMMRWMNREMAKVSAPMPNKAFTLRQLGLSEETISFVLGSPADMNRRLAQGAVTATSQRSADIAQKWQDASTTLTQALTKLGQIFVDDVLPPLTTIAAFLGRWLGGVAQEKEASLDRAPQTVTDMNRRRADRWQHRAASTAGGQTRNRETLPWPASDVVPGSVIEKAKAVAVQGGPGAVEEFMASQGYPKSGDWCGEFAASVIRSIGGHPPANPAVASNWRNWGTADQVPQTGDVAVRRGVRTGDVGSHVTFVEGVDARSGRFTGIGGNQGSFKRQFSISDYDFRRPTGAEAAAAITNSTVTSHGGDVTTTHVTNNVGDVHVTAPHGTDPNTFAGSIKFALDYRLATLGNYGQRP
jgi:uncharacterized protein (TIGR02594 family)